LASDGGFFIFMFWYFHRGLKPRLQRAHAGHTQAAAPNRLTRPESNFHRDYNPQSTVNARLPSGGWCALTFAIKNSCIEKQQSQ